MALSWRREEPGSIHAIAGNGGSRERRTTLLLGILLACLAASLLVGCSGSAPDGEGVQASARPNVVFILADDMRADDFEYMPRTRQLLAEEGLAFDNAFVAHSLCCPSRASILRGQYTHNHQVWTNNPPDGGFSEFRSMGHEDSTVATWLKDEGYQTALIGKYLNGYARRDEETYVPPGWDEWHGVLGGGDYYDYRLNENGEVVSYGGEEQDYQTDVLADKARDYVRRVDGSASPSPFFLYLAPGTPHGPFVPAPRHKGAYDEEGSGSGVGAPRRPSFYESDVGDKPEWVRDLPLLKSAEETAEAGEEATEEEYGGSDEESPVGTEEMIDSAYRTRLEMLLSLDDMVAGLVDELRALGELDNTYIFRTYARTIST
ncbi:MAG: sulfatase, partial [Rubrobacteraceae bacterium]